MDHRKVCEEENRLRYERKSYSEKELPLTDVPSSEYRLVSAQKVDKVSNLCQLVFENLRLGNADTELFLYREHEIHNFNGVKDSLFSEMRVDRDCPFAHSFDDCLKSLQSLILCHFVTSILRSIDTRCPRQADAETAQQQILAGLQSAVVHQVCERNGNCGGNSIATISHINDYFVEG